MADKAFYGEIYQMRAECSKFFTRACSSSCAQSSAQARHAATPAACFLTRLSSRHAWRGFSGAAVAWFRAA